MNVDMRAGYEGLKEKKDQEKQEKIDKEKIEQINNLEKKIKISKIKEELRTLKDLVELGIIDAKIVDNIEGGIVIEEKEIREIFEKLEEIDEIDNIDKILPKDLRVTKEMYILALQNKENRKEMLSKINIALDYLYNSNYNGDNILFNVFFSFLGFLNKNLKIIQENYIDIKDNLMKKQ